MIVVDTDAHLLREVWRLHHHMSADDAPYLVAAVRFGVDLLTCGARLARAARRIGQPVRLITG
ncbi:MAG: hypothetical protein FWC46_10115 [Actinomycetia bacterium]|nr:hypothetical protein [Actinomycetes bacterium]